MDPKVLLAVLSMLADTDLQPTKDIQFNHKKRVKRIVNPKKKGYRGKPSKNYDPITKTWLKK